jgi:zinc D-Ala-D-Ala carboxypeptidase
MKYFSLNEFESPDLQGSGVNMDSNFLSMLDQAREYAGIPFRITSGYRTEQHNRKVNGKERTESSKGSSHMYGLACDIACTNSKDRYTIITALMDAGFNRIGVGSTFIHVDSDPDKAQDVIWTY